MAASTPPPLPDAPSRKRILPALFLAGSVGFLGLHRFYAGRYITGLVQLVLFIPGAVMLWPDLMRMRTLQTLEDVLDWSANYQIRPVPWLLLSIPLFWAVGDCLLLVRGRFRDGAGNKISRWV